MTPAEKNWAGNITFGARRLRTPGSEAELQEIVATGTKVRALGTRHSFSTVADTAGDLVSVAGLPRTVDIDREAGTVTVSAGLRFGEFADELHRSGFALHNLGSLPHISVAGACATGTHGSGVGNTSLAGAVRALDMVTADGTTARLARGDADFPGAVVALGALGVVTRLTLDLVPAFDVRQWVYEDLPQARIDDRAGFDEVMSAAYSVSLFTDWRGGPFNQVWLKQRVGADGPAEAPAEWLGAGSRTVRATRSRACRPRTARGSRVFQVHGTSVCRTSGWSSPRATGTSCSRSTSWQGATPRQPSRRSTGSGTGSPRCCRSARSAPWPATTCG